MADVGVFIKNADIQARCGVNANTTAKAIAATDAYVLDIEAQINCACKFNFSDNYASLNADVQTVLKECGASFAAINVIMWDISGFTSRAEAELMLDVLLDKATRALNTLKEQSVQDWLKAGATGP